MFDSLKNALSSTWNKVKEGASSKIQGAKDAAYGGVKKAVDKVTTAASDTRPGFIKKGASALGSLAGRGLGAVKDLAMKPVKFAASLPGRAVRAVGGAAIDKVTSYLPESMQSATNKALKGAGKAAMFVGSLPFKILGKGASAAGGAIADSAKNKLYTTFVKPVKRAWKANVVNPKNDFVDNIRDKFGLPQLDHRSQKKIEREADADARREAAWNKVKTPENVALHNQFQSTGRFKGNRSADEANKWADTNRGEVNHGMTDRKGNFVPQSDIKNLMAHKQQRGQSSNKYLSEWDNVMAGGRTSTQNMKQKINQNRPQKDYDLKLSNMRGKIANDPTYQSLMGTAANTPLPADGGALDNEVRDGNAMGANGHGYGKYSLDTRSFRGEQPLAQWEGTNPMPQQPPQPRRPFLPEPMPQAAPMAGAAPMPPPPDVWDFEKGLDRAFNQYAPPPPKPTVPHRAHRHRGHRHKKTT